MQNRHPGTSKRLLWAVACLCVWMLAGSPSSRSTATELPPPPLMIDVLEAQGEYGLALGLLNSGTM